MARRRRKKPEMVGDKPKFRFVKAKKRRGIRALGRRRAIGGMERQILNPATGKYVAYLGPKQEMRLYSPDALAKIEKKEGARKIKAAEIKKKAATPLPAPPKPKAKKPEPKPDVGRPKAEDKPKVKKPPPKVRVTEAKPKAKPKAPAKAKVAARPRSREDIKIDIPKVINIPGVGDIKLPSKPPAAPKAKVKAKPKKEVKTPKKGAKAKSRPTPKPRPVKLPDALREDILREDIRIKPGALEGLTAKPVVKTKEKPKPKKEVKTPKKGAKAKPKSTAPESPRTPEGLIKRPSKGKIREREDIRVPTREEIDKVIKDLDIKIPEVINIPGVGQVTIPAAPKPPVETSEESAPRMGKIVSGPVLTTPGGPGGGSGGRGGIFGNRPDPSNLSELDKLKQRFDMLTSMRFVKDPGPEHYQRIKELGDQIYALDKNFKSEYYTPDDQSAPTPPTTPTAPKDRFAGTLTQEQIRDLFERDLMDYDDDYFYDKDGIFGEKGLSYKKGVPEDVVDQIAADVNQAANQAKTAPPPVAAPPPSDVMPGEVFMDEPKYRPPGDPVSAPTPPKPPQIIDMDPLKGFRETYIPRNILGQSFDPSVRDDYEKQMQAARAAMMQPGGNIRASEYPTYQTPTLAVPQTQFGGYGQPMPVAPLLPYAGLATATPPQEIPRPPASGATPNPGTGQIEPIGVAPDPGLVNLPPGVTGPIR